MTRMTGFISVEERLPDVDQEVEVLRCYGLVCNTGHPAYGMTHGVELTKYMRGGFLCDFISTGYVIGWLPAQKIEASGYPEAFMKAFTE